MRKRRWWSDLVFYVLIGLFMVPTLFVFYWMVALSLKSQVDNLSYPPVFFFKPVLDNYRQVLVKTPFLKYTWNSFVVAMGSTAVGMALALPAAYSIARFKQRKLAVALLVARMIPAIAFLVPWYILFRQLRLLDTFTGLSLSHLVVNLPLMIWMMIAFFEDLPQELHEASLIDGCSTYSSFWRVALPLVRPGVAATAILGFIFSWNNFLFSVILAGRTTRTLPVAVFSLINYEEIVWGSLGAAATLITLPVLALALIMQRHIVSGLTFGAVKG